MRLVIFDCDGTLVDSQHAIYAAMGYAFTTLGLPPPSRADVLGVIGLSLPQSFAVLAPRQPLSVQAELAQLYRSDFPGKRVEGTVHDPLFAGIGEVITTLARRDDILLGIATGKSRRGVARILQREGWSDHFVTIQTADDHPSKPHPSMILRARSAGVGAIGVAWGYHEPERLWLAGAHAVAASCDALIATLEAQLDAQEAGA